MKMTHVSRVQMKKVVTYGSPVPYQLVDVGLRADDWGALVARRPNALIEGPAHVVDRVLMGLWPTLQKPIFLWSPGVTFRLPEDQSGTVVIHEIARLDAGQQHWLFRWMSKPSPVRILSTTSTRVHLHSKGGTFLDDLYYRLNVLYIKVSDGRAWKRPVPVEVSEELAG